jgi:site-specific DNA recombinase
MRGFLICPACGGNYTASTSKGRRSYYSYYHCQNGCRQRVGTDTAHDYFGQWLTKIAIKPEISALYLEVMQDIFKSNEADRDKEILKLSRVIKDKESMLDRATQKLVLDELDKESYQRLKQGLQKEIMELNIQMSNLKEIESGYMEYLRFGFTLLGNPLQYYSTATLQGKQSMLGSIFPEKLVFENKKYRTAQPNEVVALLGNVTKAFGNSENKKAPQNEVLSCEVAGE